MMLIKDVQTGAEKATIFQNVTMAIFHFIRIVRMNLCRD